MQDNTKLVKNKECTWLLTLLENLSWLKSNERFFGNYNIFPCTKLGCAVAKYLTKGVMVRVTAYGKAVSKWEYEKTIIQ